MPEPVTITVSLIALLKAIGVKAAVTKAALIVKGLTAAGHGKGLIIIAKQAIITVKANGLAIGMKQVADLLIILGTCSAGSIAYICAKEALEEFANGNIKEGSKKAARAIWEAKSSYSGIKLFS